MKYILTFGTLLLLAYGINYAMNYLSDSRQMIVCYNAGTFTKCDLVKRGGGW